MRNKVHPSAQMSEAGPAAPSRMTSGASEVSGVPRLKPGFGGMPGRSGSLKPNIWSKSTTRREFVRYEGPSLVRSAGWTTYSGAEAVLGLVPVAWTGSWTGVPRRLRRSCLLSWCRVGDTVKTRLGAVKSAMRKCPCYSGST